MTQRYNVQSHTLCQVVRTSKVASLCMNEQPIPFSRWGVGREGRGLKDICSSLLLVAFIKRICPSYVSSMKKYGVQFSAQCWSPHTHTYVSPTPMGPSPLIHRMHYVRDLGVAVVTRAAAPPTYRVSLRDHAVEADDVWVGKLSHDGRLPQEPHPVLGSGMHIERLDGHFLGVAPVLPQPPLNGTKLSRS